MKTPEWDELDAGLRERIELAMILCLAIGAAVGLAVGIAVGVFV